MVGWSDIAEMPKPVIFKKWSQYTHTHAHMSLAHADTEQELSLEHREQTWTGGCPVHRGQGRVVPGFGPYQEAKLHNNHAIHLTGYFCVVQHGSKW